MARGCSNEGLIQFNGLVKIYARKRGVTGVAHAMVRAVTSRGIISGHSDHVWAIRTFITFSRCAAADALEAADQEFVTSVENWLDKSFCWKPVQTNAQLNPCIWQELALARATVLEVKAKLMVRGGQFDAGEDLIRKAVFIWTSICGENQPDTISARETHNKLTRLLANTQNHTSQ